MTKNRILIVDNQLKIFQTIESILKNEHYELFYASDGEDAYNQYCIRPFDLIISDINMQDASGTELLQKIKSININAIVSLMTDYADVKQKKEILKLGAFDYLIKPIQKHEIIESINKALDKKDILDHDKIKPNNFETSLDEKTEILKIQKEALQREQERTRGIIEEAHIGFLVVDGYSEEVFLLNNLGKKHLNIKEESKNNYLYKNYKEIFSNQIIDILSKIMLKIQNERKVIDFGDFIIGEELMLSIVSYPIMMDEKISSIVIATTDVTEKQILEKQILQTSRLADIGELAAVVAHEINNPVAFVDSNTHALKKYVTKISTFMTKVNEIEDFLEKFHIDEDNILDVYQDVLSLNNVIEEKKEELKKLKESLKINKTIKSMKDIIFENLDGLDRIKKIVSDLKTFSYMGDEKLENSNINTILDDSIKLIWNTIKYKLKIIRKYESLPEYICLPRQMSQVFSNIIINASHAVESDGEIILETFIENNSINIRISDNGSGMSEQTIKRIFNPFYTTKKLHSGTGLGLSISLKIIDKHNGTIRVKSELNYGTSFLISLPLN